MMDPIKKKLNLVEICVNWIGGQDWNLESKSNMAFQLMTGPKKEAIAVERIVELCCWLELDPIVGRKARKIRREFEGRKRVSSEEFGRFIRTRHPNLFDADFLRGKGRMGRD